LQAEKMRFFKPLLSSPGCRFGQTMLGRLLTMVPSRWLILLMVVAIPLVFILWLVLFILLLVLLIFSPVFYLLALPGRLKARRESKVIEVDYWVKPED
jgi:hypothetical protein